MKKEIYKFINFFTVNYLNFEIKRIFPRYFEKNALKGNSLVGVEIGVNNGEHSYSMFKTGKVEKLYLIDPYEEYPEMDNLDIAKEKAYDLLENENVLFIYKKSENAVNDVPDELDFVYIDGSHDYENVKKDIKNYWGKVRVGGVLGGHDMANGKHFEGEEYNGVVKAVTEFVIRYNLKLYIENREWWVIKKDTQDLGEERK